MRHTAILIGSFLIASQALGEGVGTRENLPASSNRISGVQTLSTASWRIFSLGGKALRYLPKGAKKWQVLLSVPGDDLYRLSADDSGRVLASWSKEKKFHLLVPALKKNLTFPKPPAKQDGFKSSGLEGLFFTEDGKGIAVYEDHFPDGSTAREAQCWLYDAAGKAKPQVLFRQKGFRIYSSGRAAVFVVPKNEKNPCDSRGCQPIAAIVAYEITSKGVLKRTLLSGEGDDLSNARLASVNDTAGLALIVIDNKNGKHLLRWSPGQSKADYRPLPPGPSLDYEKCFLKNNGDFMEIWKAEDDSLQMRTYTQSGPRTLTLPPPPPGDPDVELDTQVYAVRERTKGGLMLHWGDYLYLLEEGQEPRRLGIVSLLARMEEWAGVDIYFAQPEALWLGVEVGDNRDFLRLGFDEIGKKAKPLSEQTAEPMD